MKKFLIVGANFANKGAQSMLFVTVDEISKRFPDSDIYFATCENIKEFDTIYKFKKIYYNYRTKHIALGGISAIFNLIKSLFVDFIKFFLRTNDIHGHYFDVKRLIPQLDLIVDVSGYSLGDKWSKVIQEDYLDNIRLASKYKVPIVMMPQSFGPFNNIDKMKDIKREISILFKYPREIFAREVQGVNELKNKFNITNIRLSTDLVLQNREINIDNIYLKKKAINTPECNKGEKIGIVPNDKCIKHGKKEYIMNLYKILIDELISMGKQVYIFMHSAEDINICCDIYDIVHKCDKVHLIKNEFSCLEYEKFVKNFEFILVSRYHGAIHAYRNIVPCVILGWAEKYFELARNMDQIDFAFDITKNNFSIKQVIDVIHKMNEGLQNEKKKIKYKIDQIQSYNCFDIIEEAIK